MTYFENNRAGISVFGFMLDRTSLHTIVTIEMSLVLWLLGKTIGISWKHNLKPRKSTWIRKKGCNHLVTWISYTKSDAHNHVEHCERYMSVRWCVEKQVGKWEVGSRMENGLSYMMFCKSVDYNVYGSFPFEVICLFILFSCAVCLFTN